MSPQRLTVWCSATCLLAMSIDLSQAGTVYRWVDAQGRVHYGDQAQASAIAVLPGSGIGAKPVATDSSKAVAAAAAACEESRQQLAAYQGASQITETDALGQTREYTPEQRARLVQISEQKVQQACTHAGS